MMDKELSNAAQNLYDALRQMTRITRKSHQGVIHDHLDDIAGKVDSFLSSLEDDGIIEEVD